MVLKLLMLLSNTYENKMIKICAILNMEFNPQDDSNLNILLKDGFFSDVRYLDNNFQKSQFYGIKSLRTDIFDNNLNKGIYFLVEYKNYKVKVILSELQFGNTEIKMIPYEKVFEIVHKNESQASVNLEFYLKLFFCFTSSFAITELNAKIS